MYSIELWDFDEDVIENLTDADVQEAVTKGIVERWAKKNLLINCQYWKIDNLFLYFWLLAFSRSGSKE